MPRGKKLRVGVLFGGRSGEHEVSLRSALTVISALNPARYEVVPIGIARDGRWYLRNDAIEQLRKATPQLRSLSRGGDAVALPPYPGHQTLIPIESAYGSAKRRSKTALSGKLDVIFPVLHGTYGEDGTVQGLLDLTGIPYVGSGVLGSAIGMDKDVQKCLLRDANIPVVRYCSITRVELEDAPKLASRQAAELGYPVFVKPNALGSSIGIARVAKPAQLKAAIDDAFQYDQKVLIEESCAGREFECAVLGNERPEASVPGEVLVKGGHDFYSYESKYVDPEGSETRIPADIPAKLATRIREISVAAFKVLSLRGMARVDFLASNDLKQLYVNEVNTIPGFTAISMYPKMWAASGIPLEKLVERLIDLAIADHRTRSKLSYTYVPRA
ncbi:MAG TPA: D-alanine--D-alanine ligase family protein [Candidatus Binataceae bacterium]|nr:D-alanine--D-alanine ligase family protein [Candidatus Binataceae bacterium]